MGLEIQPLLQIIFNFIRLFFSMNFGVFFHSVVLIWLEQRSYLRLCVWLALALGAPDTTVFILTHLSLGYTSLDDCFQEGDRRPRSPVFVHRGLCPCALHSLETCGGHRAPGPQMFPPQSSEESSYLLLSNSIQRRNLEQACVLSLFR